MVIDSNINKLVHRIIALLVSHEFGVEGQVRFCVVGVLVLA